jgi:predicted nucleic-acid-binding Zn-ribbon protein
VFFQDTLNHLQVCPKCGIDRFVDGSKSIPWKVFWHFTLIPRLLWMYRCKSLAHKWNWCIWSCTKCGGWKHDQLDTKSSYHSCSHIFAHKCKKVESKHFQSISNYHVAQ